MEGDEAYEYYDYNPVQGIQYYRLKQTDFDGKYDYSNIVSVEYDINSPSETTLYPNPTGGLFTLNIKGNEPVDISVKLVNTLGQVVMEGTKLSGNTFSFDISEQANGVYYFEVTRNGCLNRYKLVKN